MTRRLTNVPVYSFTECRIASHSGAIEIKSKKDIPFPEYGLGKNFSFQGGGKFQFVLDVHKKELKI